MTVWMKDYGRPIGVEPKIFLTKPVMPTIDPVEVEPGYFLDDPWAPSLEDFPNELAARRFYKEHYPDQYSRLEIIP